MYYTYEISPTARVVHFKRLKEAHLFGCNVGVIPHLLRDHVSENQGEPYAWHLQVERVLAPLGHALIIDLKPNNKDLKASLSLYQLRDVWGYSDFGWTPAMFRLRGLSVDNEPLIEDPTDFTIELSPINDAIYTFVQFGGTVRNGSLAGLWTSAPRSSTNSVLLWPKALSYFIGQIRKTTPHLVLTAP